NGFGSYTVTAAGVWTYALDNNKVAVQALNVGDTLTHRFIVTTIGGATQVVTITITGANDASVVTGDTAGSVVEANGSPGIPTVSGHLDSADPDNPDDAWAEVGTATASTGGFGSYTMTDEGVWSYTLD